MTTMVMEVYDALVEAGASRDSAARAASALTGDNADIAAIKTDVAQLTTGVAQLKTDVAQLKIDVAQLRTDVDQLKIDVAVLKSDMATIKWLIGFMLVTQLALIARMFIH
jgi:phage shock protein A